MNDSPRLGSRYRTGARAFSLTPVQAATRDAILKQERPEYYEPASCLCGDATASIVLTQIERHGLPCRNVLCPNCGLIRISPRWKEDRYSSFYATQYRNLYNRIELTKAEFAKSVAESAATRGFGAWILRTQAAHGKSQGRIRIVEIGAGGGWNLSALPAEWERIGYDVDEEYLEIGRSAFGVEMRRGFMKEALENLADADFVLLSHVAEHFLDPVKSLAEIRAAMKPSGLLLVEVPGLFRIHKTHLDPMVYMQNAHTFTFCASTLRDTCARAGWQVLECDEICRAVCASGPAPAGPHMPDPDLSQRILIYLNRCQQGWAPYLLVSRIPLVRGVVIRILKRFYFPMLRRYVATPDGVHGRG